MANQRFISWDSRLPKNVKILVVTVTGWGVDLNDILDSRNCLYLPIF